jgi:lipopolysaccharide export system permease protein
LSHALQIVQTRGLVAGGARGQYACRSMAIPGILWGYVLRDVAVHALLALAALTLVIVTANVLHLLEDLVGTGIALPALGQVMLAILPTYLCYAIPTAIVFGVLITFGRMASDSEIPALQASGISVAQMLPPVLALGAVAALATAFLMAEVSPRSYTRMKHLARDLSRKAVLFDPGEFREIGGQVFYFRSRGGEDCPLRGVIITDLGDPERQHFITSACGELSGADSDDALVAHLRSGSIHVGDSRERYRLLRFDEMELPLDVSSLIQGRRWPREFTTRELVAIETGFPGLTAEWVRLLWVQLHQRVAFPLASIVLALVAVPLGIRPLQVGRSAGTLTAIAVVGSYWLLTSAGETLAESGQIHVLPGVWFPDLLFLGLGIALMRRSSTPDS